MSNSKIVFASDIHGSAFWCEKLLEFCRRQNPDKIVLLGDLLYHGPRNPLPDGHNPQGVAQMLSSIKEKLVCVRGNCDAEVDQMVLPFPIMADYALMQAGNRTLYLTHGHLFSHENVPPVERGTVLFNGHFHVPCHKQLDCGVLYVNCGSVALPKENSAHSCMLLDGDKLVWIDLATGKSFDEIKL